jgi:threonine/homoserine/homoserine lactone efflux protein
MLETAAFAAFVAASLVIVLVPGPTVSVIIANSLRYGTRAGLLIIAGTQIGLASMLVIVAAGLQFVVERMAGVFEFVRIAGAVYLIYLGYRLLRGGKFELADGGRAAPRGQSFVWQGFVVIWSNPKALLLFGAMIPQFVSLGENAMMQTVLLGVTFMAIATVSDAAYAVAAGGAGRWLTRSRVRAIEKISGTMLVGAGIWLALTRR